MASIRSIPFRCLLTVPLQRRHQLVRLWTRTTRTKASSSSRQLLFVGGLSRLTTTRSAAATTSRSSPSYSMHPCATGNTKRFSTATSSADGTRLFFEWLERSYGARFGGKPLPMDATTTGTATADDSGVDSDEDGMVVTRNSLELVDLERLFCHEIAALRVRGFYPAGTASDLGRELASEGHSQSAQNWKVSTSRGLESSDVVTVGKHPPYNIALANNALENYFGAVRNELRDRRGLPLSVAMEEDRAEEPPDARHMSVQQQRVPSPSPSPSQPRLWPLDLLRLELDELWPGGAGLARAETGTGKNRCMGGGLPRLMVGPTRWKKGLVHVDELAPLDRDKGCFSANIYLQLPYGSGGDSSNGSSSSSAAITSPDDNEQPVMEIWPLGIRSKWDWYRNAPTLSHLTSQDPEGQVVLRKVLGTEHKRCIRAVPGDLVLLCVQRPHCAIGFGHRRTGDGSDENARPLQTRVSLQCFLQYNGSEERLTIDS